MSACVFYHDYGTKQCADGFLSAYIAREFLKSSHDFVEVHTFILPETQQRIIPCVQCNFDEIFFVDVCPSIGLLENIRKNTSAKIVIIDHHVSNKSTIEHFNKVDGVETLYVTEGMSGASLTYKYFSEKYKFTLSKDTTDIVQFFEDYDLWTKKYFNTKYLIQYFYSLGPWRLNTFENFIHAFKTQEAFRLGRLLYEKEHLQIQEIARNYFYIDLLFAEQFYRVEACFTNGTSASLLGEYLYSQKTTHGFVVLLNPSYNVLTKTLDLHCSLRASETCMVDMSEVARFYGGGGHKKAAGFVAPFSVIEGLIVKDLK